MFPPNQLINIRPTEDMMCAFHQTICDFNCGTIHSTYTISTYTNPEVEEQLSTMIKARGYPTNHGSRKKTIVDETYSVKIKSDDEL